MAIAWTVPKVSASLQLGHLKTMEPYGIFETFGVHEFDQKNHRVFDTILDIILDIYIYILLYY